MSRTEIYHHALICILQHNELVRCRNRTVLAHLRKRLLGEENRTLVGLVFSKCLSPPKSAHLHSHGERNRNLLAFPGWKFPFRILGRLDHDLVFLKFQNTPYLTAGNKHCPRANPADDKRLVKRSDRLSGNDIKDHTLLFVCNHREVQRQILSGAGFGDNHTILGPDKIVLLHLGDNIADKRACIRKAVAPGKNPLDVFNRYLTPLNRKCCYLVCDDICRIHVRPDIFRTVVGCQANDYHRL